MWWCLVAIGKDCVLDLTRLDHKVTKIQMLDKRHFSLYSPGWEFWIRCDDWE